MSTADFPFEAAIDSHPLVVEPDILLAEVVILMSQTRGVTCSLPDLEAATDSCLTQEARSSCVLIMQGQELLGIFTERDIVRLTAAGVPFDRVTIGEVMVKPVITLSKVDFHDIFAALFLFRRYRIRHLVIVDSNQQPVGVVSPESIRQVLRPTNLLKLRRVADVMTTQVISAPLTASALSLTQQMSDHRVSCIVIVEDDIWCNDEQVLLPVGIVTERDIVQFQSLGLNLATIRAETVMSTPLFLVSPEDSLWTAHQEMQRRQVQRLVVSWNWGKQLGLVTQTSLLKVFDPIEMYGVIEALQRSLQQQNSQPAPLEGEDGVRLISQPPPVEQPAFVRAKETPSPEGQPNSQVATLLTGLQVRLKNLANYPEMSAQLRQASLWEAIADIQQLHDQILGIETTK
ncbi:MAG: CBS domain-containing protein [Leptolyngbyaceae cyanobacterium]